MALLDSEKDAPDGIITGVSYSKEVRARLSASTIPIVMIGSGALDRKTKCAIIHNDNRGAGEAAADYFLALGGFRAFAYLADPKERQWSVLRGAGFRHRLRKRGQNCTVLKSDDPKLIAKLLKGLQKPAAVLAAWDQLGAIALEAANKRGIKVPKDVAILGVDNDEGLCDHTRPSLSSIQTDAEAMGMKAAEAMDKLLSDRRRKRETMLTDTCPIVGIVERESTKPPAISSFVIRKALDIIERDATSGIGVEEVAKRMGVSRSLIDMRFRQYGEMSVGELLSAKKLKEVKRLLAESKRPIKDIFADCGFKCAAYAHRLFKRATGMTASAWRKKFSIHSS